MENAPFTKLARDLLTLNATTAINAARVQR